MRIYVDRNARWGDPPRVACWTGGVLPMAIQKSWVYPLAKIVFPFYGLNVLVQLIPQGKNTPPKTSLECLLSSSKNYKFHIYPESVITHIGKTFGYKEIRVNHRPFDDAFLIRGSDEVILRHFLTKEIQNQLMSLDSYAPELSLRKNRLISRS